MDDESGESMEPMEGKTEHVRSPTSCRSETDLN